MKNKFQILYLIMLTLCWIPSGAQQKKLYDISVYPTTGEWTFETGERVKFNVLLTRSNIPYGNEEVKYEISEDMMSPRKTGTLKLKDGKGVIEAGTMKEPGFLRCRVYWEHDGRKYEGRATVGFSAEELRPVTTQPADFRDFWDKTLANARKWALEPKMTLNTEKSTPKVNVYDVSWGNDGWESRMYGVLTVPTAPGKYPAILKLPGAGVRGYNGEISHAEKGVMILEIGIHGIPVNLPAETYVKLYNGALKGYHSFNMDDPDRYYYKRVLTGCVRAIDFIEQLPDFNGCLATFGGSQGGGLSIIVAGLDPRVDALVAFYPAMSDMAGYTAGRAGGWPHTLKDSKYHTPEILNTLSYYDVSSFAREVTAPGFYAFGYNDMVCPPTSTMAVYNVIDAPKQLMVAETTEHFLYDEQSAAAWKWVIGYLKQCSKP